jgi:hypothetical protein
VDVAIEMARYVATTGFAGQQKIVEEYPLSDRALSNV